MRKKTALHYERWAIFAGKEKKPLLVGTFYGALPDAKKHAEAAISRLRERIQKHKTPLSR